MTYQNVCHELNRTVSGKFIFLNICIRKEGSTKGKDISFHLKKLKREEQIKPK